MASLCAYPAWYLISWWRRPRTPTGHPLGRLIYGGTVLSCSPLIPIHPLPPSPPFPLFSFPICVPVRLARRLVGRLVIPSRLMRLAVSCRPSCRLACSSRWLVSACRLVSRRFVLLFACSRFACRGDLALRSHAVSFALGVSSCSCVSPIVSSVLSRSFPSSRFCSLVGVSCPFSCPFSCSVPVFAPFCSAVRSFLFAYSLPVHVLGRGAWPCRYGHGAGLALLISSVPSRLPVRLFARSLWDGGGRIRHEAPFRVARRSFLGVHRSSFFSSHRFLIARIACPFLPSTKQEKRRRRAEGADGDRTGTIKTRRIETRRPTRRNNETPDETSGGGKMIRMASKQRDARRDGDARRGNETPTLMRTNGRRRRAMSRFASFSKHHDTNEIRRKGIPFIISPDPLSPALSHPPASISPPPPGRGMR